MYGIIDQEMFVKQAARVVLHQIGGLAALRFMHRRKFGVVMFHSFQEADRANLEDICAHIVRHCEPVSLSDVARCLSGGRSLPDHAVTVTVDDGYRNFLLHGHAIFRRYRIPVTLYAVAGFSDGRLWLWPDQIEFGFEHTPKTSLAVEICADLRFDFALSSASERRDAFIRLTETLKDVSDDRRREFLARFGQLCGVEFPQAPPPHRAAMNWDELRAVASEGVEIGCHTESHPILSRITDPVELRREIAGAKETLEERLGFPVIHFCYPNGRRQDISAAAVACVRDAGFSSGVTCDPGLNTANADRFSIHRMPFDGSTPLHYGAELLAGLHA